jgi:hypothetical protein
MMNAEDIDIDNFIGASVQTEGHLAWRNLYTSIYALIWNFGPS